MTNNMFLKLILVGFFVMPVVCENKTETEEPLLGGETAIDVNDAGVKVSRGNDSYVKRRGLPTIHHFLILKHKTGIL